MALSVMVLGGGHWAQAFLALLKYNQQKQRGSIYRVLQYSPPKAGSSELLPAQRPAQHKAASDDATMQLAASALSSAMASLPNQFEPASPQAGSDDITIRYMAAEAPAGAVSEEVATADPISKPIKDLGTADLLILAIPAAQVRSFLRQVSGVLRPHQMLIHNTGSFFPSDPKRGQRATLISDVVRQETPITRIGALAGPAIAEDLEDCSPAAFVCGSVTEGVIAATRQVLGAAPLRIYGSTDLIGVEVAQAMSGIVALASGLGAVLEFGPSARAVLVSRSAAELARLGMALGGRERTFMGLAGIGGLLLASTDHGSADFQLGRLLGSGQPLSNAQKQLNRPCTSTGMLRDAHDLAESHGLRTPTLTTLYRLVYGKVELGRAIKDLLEDSNYTE